MKQLSILCCLLFLTLGINSSYAKPDSHPANEEAAPSDAHVTGHVIDAVTGEHLPGISISLKGTSIGTTTDKTGHYFIKNIKPGDYILVMRSVGYKTQEKPIKVIAKKTLEVHFEAEEDRISLDEVVVSSNRQLTLRRQAPTLVNVLGSELCEMTNANNISQGLVYQPGVRVENNCQNCGFTQVRINGLDGRYTQLLIDSRPIMSALSGVYGLEQIPTNMIDRIEVVRGGGSALFGSSAIAGVVNIITKEPTSNQFSLGESLTLLGMTSVDNNLNVNASMVSDNGRIGGMLFGQARNRSAWDANNDGYSEIGKINAKSLGAHVYFRPTDFSKLSAEIHSITEARRGGSHLDRPSHAAAVSEATNHTIFSGNLKFDIFSPNDKHRGQVYISAQSVNRDSYYGAIPQWDDDWGKLGKPVPPEMYGVNYGHTRGLTFNGGLQYSYSMDRLLFMPAQLLVGAEYTGDRLRDRLPIREWEQDPSGAQLFEPLDQQIHNWSQLAQLEWKLDNFSLLLGTRLDEHNALKKPILSPRAAIRYAPSEHFNFRLGYAKGFRAPQVFDEDLHVGVVGGEPQKIFNTPNLRPEISHAINLSADTYFNIGDELQGNILLEGFANRLLDVFTNVEQVSQGDGITRFGRVNGSGAKVYGLNLEGKIAYHWVQLQLGFTWAKSLFDAPEEWGLHATFVGDMPVMTAQSIFNPDTGKNEEKRVYNVSQTSRQMLRTPATYGYFTLGLNPYKPLNLAVTGTYTGRMYVPHAIVYGDGAAISDQGHKPLDVVPDETNNTEIRIDELVHTRPFFDLGARVSYDFRINSTANLQLFAGMHNIFNAFQSDFDSGVNRDSGYIYGPTLPRSAYFGIRLNF